MKQRSRGRDDRDEDDAHPHRCRRGHRWHHTGPTVATCEIPPYDLESGDLPYVSPEDCPVCTGREDVLIRALHDHHCVICDGDWAHEGRCLEEPFATCPWCLPQPGAGPAPGERKGRHLHFCPESGKDWEHLVPCAAPLRAVRDPHVHQAGRDRARPRTRAASLRALTVGLATLAFGLGTAVVGLRLIDSGTGAGLPRKEPVDVRAPAAGVTGLTLHRSDARTEPQDAGAPQADTDGPAPDGRHSGARDRATGREPVGTRSARSRALRPSEPESRSETMPARSTPEAPVGTRPPTISRPGEGQGVPPALPAPALPSSLALSAPQAPATLPASPLRPLVAEPPRPLPAPRPVVTGPEVAEARGSAGSDSPMTRPGALSGPQGASHPEPAERKPGGPGEGGGREVTPESPLPPLPRHGGGSMLARLSLQQTDAAAEPPLGPPLSSAPHIERRIDAAQAAVVRVLPTLRHGDGDPRTHAPRGLGVVVDPGGYILTTDAVAGGTGALDVELADGRRLPVTFIARDPFNDIAVLKVNGTGLPALALGYSNALRTGDIVATVGSRADHAGSVTRIVSTGVATGGNLVTDARGTAAGHGGPLINLRGEVVGILAASGRGGTITTAVPIDRARAILRDLRASQPAATSAHRPGGGMSER